MYFRSLQPVFIQKYLPEDAVCLYFIIKSVSLLRLFPAWNLYYKANKLQEAEQILWSRLQMSGLNLCLDCCSFLLFPSSDFHKLLFYDQVLIAQKAAKFELIRLFGFLQNPSLDFSL